MISRRTFLKAALVFAACTTAMLFAIARLQSAETIPSQVSDEAFWKMVTTMSEPDGQFRYENFLSNELQYQYVIPALKSTTRPGGAYMGVGPEQNFTYIVALQPKIAFIIDIRRQNMLELLMYKAIFELSPDRADFLSMLFSRVRPEGLHEKATADQLFRAYLPVSRDETLYQKNVKAIQNLLVQKHQFGLSLTDLKNIAYVYGVFASDGPYLDYSSGGLGTAPGGGMPNYSELMVAGRFAWGAAKLSGIRRKLPVHARDGDEKSGRSDCRGFCGTEIDPGNWAVPEGSQRHSDSFLSVQRGAIPVFGWQASGLLQERCDPADGYCQYVYPDVWAQWRRPWVWRRQRI